MSLAHSPQTRLLETVGARKTNCPKVQLATGMQAGWLVCDWKSKVPEHRRQARSVTASGSLVTTEPPVQLDHGVQRRSLLDVGTVVWYAPGGQAK